MNTEGHDAEGHETVSRHDENAATPTDGEHVSFDEFKMYYESAELVTDRRIATNRWNYSVCIALLAAISVLAGWTASNRSYYLITALVALTFAVLGVFFCTYWLKEITAAKLLNSAKFQVLNDMAKNLQHDGTTSFDPFSKEWEILLSNQGASETRGLRGLLALSSSDAELFIPRAARAIFGGIGVATIVFVILGLIIPGTRPYLPIAPPTPSQSPTTVMTTTTSTTNGDKKSTPLSQSATEER